MDKNEWTASYLIQPEHPFAPEARQRDEAADAAARRALADVPAATATVLSVQRTPSGRYTVRVLRKRTIGGDL